MPPTRAPRALLRPISGTAAVSAFAMTASFFSSLLQARSLGAVQRGIFVLMATISSIVALLAAGGIGQAARSTLGTSPPTVGTGAYLRESIRRAAIAPVLAIVAGGVARLLSSSITAPILIATALLSGSLTIQTCASDLLNALGLATRAALGSFAGAIFLLITNALFLAFSKPLSAAVALLLAAGGSAIASCAAAASVRNGASRQTFGQDVLRDTARRAQRFTLAQAIALRLDRIVVFAVGGPAVAGVYSLLVGCTEPARLLSNAAGQQIAFEAARRSLTIKVLGRTEVGVVACSAVALASATLIFLPRLLRSAGQEYTGHTAVLLVMILGELAAAIYFIDGRALAGSGEFRVLFLAVSAGIIAQGASIGLLTRPFGLIGAAAGNAVGYLVMAVAVFTPSRKALRNADSFILTD
jgi:O-antigen/teichoic acid export membrane protein